MSELHHFLTDIWFLLLGLIIVLYVVLDGFDLGIGTLTLLQKNPVLRSQMLLPLTGIWDANETWLVLAGGVLFGAFPLAYALILHALYIPVMLLLFGLILRGIGLEYSQHTDHPIVWLKLFGAGSLLASIAQGLILGGILGGLPDTPDDVSTFIFNWLTPFSLLTSLGVVFGYSLLGATYLLRQAGPQLMGYARCWARISAVAMLIALLVISLWTPVLYPQIAQRWLERPSLLMIAGLLFSGVFASMMLFRTLGSDMPIKNSRHLSPFVWSLIIFMLSFSGLAMSLYPSLVPGRLSIEAAASSDQTLIFMIFGIGMLFPVMLIYNSYQYFVFNNHRNTATAPLTSSTDEN